MIPPAFQYHAPSSVDDAIALLNQYGDEAKLLAGGHSLLPMMKLRFAEPEHLVDIKWRDNYRCDDLRKCADKFRTTTGEMPAIAGGGPLNC